MHTLHSSVFFVFWIVAQLRLVEYGITLYLFLFPYKMLTEHSDGYKRPQRPHDVIYVNSILMFKNSKKKRLNINVP